MQKILLTLLLVGSLFTAQTQPQSKSNLTISTTGNSNLRFTFNGYKYSMVDKTTTFQSLVPGNYPLVIYQWRSSWRGMGQYEKVYDGTVKLNPGKHLEITVMRFGKTSWDEANTESDNWGDRYNNPSPSDGYNDRDRDRDRDRDNTTDNIYKTDATQFGIIKKAINGESFDDDKLRMARISMKDASLSVNQVRELMGLLFNDDRKLELAKFAYDKCWEKNVFFSLTDALSFSTNKKALLDFLATK